MKIDNEIVCEKKMFIDSHCHLTILASEYTGEAFDQYIDQIITDAQQAQVSKMMAISINLGEQAILKQIAERHRHVVGYSVGVHPYSSQEEFAEVSVEKLVELGQSDDVWALGETGLDYFYSTDLMAQQKHSFAQHIEASKILKKPVVVHTRSAKDDTIAMIRSEQSTHGILHCFTEDWQMAQAVLDCGYYISFSGIISFKKAQDLRDVAKKVPLDRVLIETDSPYLAPVPYRGKTNQPQYVPYVAQALADVYGKTVEEIGILTSENFQRLRQGQ